MYDDECIINKENDPCSVEVINENNSISIEEKEEKIEDEVIEASPKLMITNLLNYDHIMEEKVLDALRKGKLK